MGRKKTVVGTQIDRVIKDDSLPDSVKTGLTNAIMSADGDIPVDVMEEMFKSIGIKSERYYEYAENGDYIHGLPSGQLRSFTKGAEAVQEVLTALEGTSVQVDYVRLGAPNLMHLAWMKLVSNYGYDPVTNRLMGLEATIGTEVYLSDMKIHIPKGSHENYNQSSLEVWGVPPNSGYTPFRPSSITGSITFRQPTPLVMDSRVTTDFITVSYVYKRLKQEGVGDSILLPGTQKEGSLTMTVEVPDETKEYYQVSYEVNDARKWWIYPAGSGVYTKLDDIAMQPPEVSGTFFPFAYFRYDKKSETSDKSSESYKSTKQLVKRLGLNFDQIAENIDENPDIKDVAQAMMVYGVPPETEDDLEREYLFTFFNNLYNMQEPAAKRAMAGSASIKYLTGGVQMSDGWNSVVLEIADKRFRMKFMVKNMTKKYIVGNVAGVGKYHSAVGESDYSYEYVDQESGTTQQAVTKIPYYAYRKQVSGTLYVEIRVYGMELEYYIFQQHHTTSDDNKKILLIPIDRSITEDWSIVKKEVLYARSLHFVFNSMKVIKLKWYQTGIFQIFMVIIAVVISIFIYGLDGGTLVGAALGATVGATVAAVVIQVIVNYVISLLMGELFKVIAKAIGGNLAILLAVVAAVAGAYQIIDAGSVANAPWASDLLFAANGLSQAGLAEMMGDLLDSYNDFLSVADTATQTLDDANKLLEGNKYLNPFVLFGESPTNYYNRTIHSGNVGILGISAISSYTEIALKLPDINDTVGETFYV